MKKEKISLYLIYNIISFSQMADDNYQVDYSDVIKDQFFFFLRIEPIHIRLKNPQWSSRFQHFKNNITSVLLSINFVGLNSNLWSTRLFRRRGQKRVGPLIMHADMRIVHPVIITLATVANPKSLHLSLIINLIVDWSKFESFLYPYLLFW